jgi:hypothetical protein
MSSIATVIVVGMPSGRGDAPPPPPDDDERRHCEQNDAASAIPT